MVTDASAESGAVTLSPKSILPAPKATGSLDRDGRHHRRRWVAAFRFEMPGRIVVRIRRSVRESALLQVDLEVVAAVSRAHIEILL
jgi:hypothetical protein